jgi:hypothetical protein
MGHLGTVGTVMLLPYSSGQVVPQSRHQVSERVKHRYLLLNYFRLKYLDTTPIFRRKTKNKSQRSKSRNTLVIFEQGSDIVDPDPPSGNVPDPDLAKENRKDTEKTKYGLVSMPPTNLCIYRMFFSNIKRLFPFIHKKHVSMHIQATIFPFLASFSSNFSF